MGETWGRYGEPLRRYAHPVTTCSRAPPTPTPNPTSNNPTPNPAPTPNLTLFSLNLCLIETKTQALWPDTLAVAYRLPVGVSDPSFVIRWPTPTDRR